MSLTFGRNIRPIFLIAVILAGFNTHFAHAVAANGFDGRVALEDTRKVTAFGERPAGSDNLKNCRAWIIAQLKPLGGELSLDSFPGQTPSGPVPMVNILYKFHGTSGKAIVVSGHYDTKNITMVHFVGANDGGSSAGFLIELARVLARRKQVDDIYLVFFDGEEAVGNWSGTDSRYGSRHLAGKWGTEGFLPKIKALLNVDMIGDKNLDIMNDVNSSPSLHTLIWGVAAKLGYSANFLTEQNGADDDHMPFIDAGVNAIDLLDLDYGPHGSYWHTDKDTMDKLSAHSFQVVGEVVLNVIDKLQHQTGNT
jgi:Zn-dependent M28 family amino/carboxypeptidase